MASRLQRMLEAVKLVEPAAENTETTSSLDLSSLSAASLPEEPIAPPAPVVTLTVDDDLLLPEGTALDAIYAEATVPATAFPIERLAKLVEGLNQLDATTKKTAVTAMDAADDAWQLDDVINDGRVKIAALKGHVATIVALDQEIGAEVDRRIAASQDKKKVAIESIEAQIKELEAQREAAISEAASEQASLRAQRQAAAEAGERETRRINSSAKAYESLVSLFDATASAPQS